MKIGAGIRVSLAMVLVASIAFAGRAGSANLLRVTERVQMFGPWAPYLFVVAFVIVSLAMVPLGLLTLLAGALFGLRVAVVTAFSGATIGACLMFLLSRYLAHDLVRRHLGGRPRVAGVINSVSEDGRRIAFLLRLSLIIPFSVINLAMGITSIAFADFALACVGMLPVTALFAYSGAVAGTGAGATHGGPRRPASYLFLAASLAATAVVVFVVGRTAGRSLARTGTRDC